MTDSATGSPGWFAGFGGGDDLMITTPAGLESESRVAAPNNGAKIKTKPDNAGDAA